jgi:hypothetical protein
MDIPIALSLYMSTGPEETALRRWVGGVEGDLVVRIESVH